MATVQNPRKQKEELSKSMLLYRTNKESYLHMKEYSKKYNKENREKCYANHRLWYSRNKERIKAERKEKYKQKKLEKQLANKRLEI